MEQEICTDMKRQKQKALAALIFRSLGLLTGLAGITVHMCINSALKTGFMVKHNLAYFTLQTNIFSCIIFAVLIIKSVYTLKTRQCFEVSHIDAGTHLACTYFITITMLGYWLVLTPFTGMPQNTYLLWDSLLLHTLTPLFAICDHIFFAEHGSVKKLSAFKWLAYPMLYLASVEIIADFIQEPYYCFFLGDREIELMYPYPFLDPQVMGTWGVAAVIAALLIVFTLLALLYISIDRRLARRGSGKKTEGRA